MIKLIAVLTSLISIFLLAAGSVQAQEVRDLDVYYMQEDLSMADYNAVLLDSLGLDDALVVAPPWYEDADKNSPKKWALSNSDIKWLRKSYRETVSAQISKDGGYPIVTEPGAGVLIVDIEIIYLMPYARKGENVTTRGFGEMLVQAQFRDGMTGELLAVFEGKQEVGSEYQQNTRLNNENRLTELFVYWGERIRGILDEGRND